MVPVGRLVVPRGTHKSGLLSAMAPLTWPGLVAPLPAPGLGGLFTTCASWRWIFLVNVPLGILGLVLALRVVPVGLRDANHSPMNPVGSLLGGAGGAAPVHGTELFRARAPSGPSPAV